MQMQRTQKAQYYRRLSRLLFRQLLTHSLSLCLALPVWAGTGGLCSGVLHLELPVVDWQSLPSAREPKLDSEFLKHLHALPVFQRLQQKYKDRKFKFAHRNQFDNGWTYQVHFLSEIIKAVLPHAVVEFQTGKTTPDTIPIHLNEELSSKVSLRGYLNIEMGLLKRVNPGPELLDKIDLRKKMNLTVSARIASIYERGSDLFESEVLIENLFKENLANIAILSTGMFTQDIIKRHFKNATNVKVYTSEEWTKIKPKSDFNYVILNNTNGQMHAIYKAADFAVVMGSGNLFESLHEGHPVFFERMLPMGHQSRYSDIEWSHLGSSAKATGAGFSYKNLDTLISSIRKHSNATVKTPSYLTPSDPTALIKEPTALESLLLSLERELDSL